MTAPRSSSSRARLRHRLLAAVDRIPAALTLAVAACALVVAWAAVVHLEGQAVARHLFYLPIVLVAMRFGTMAGTGAAAAAAILAGPLAGIASAQAWAPRGVMFAVVAVVVGTLASARADTVERERDLAERERTLVAERASLVQVVSHEFRTPLTVIRGGVQTLCHRPGAVDPTYRDLVHAMSRSVERLEAMLEVVLAAAEELEGGTATQEVVDLHELAAEVSRALPSQLEGRLVNAIDPGSTVVTVERDLRMILRCLLDNAARFSPEDRPVEVSCDEDHGQLRIAITDQGPGLPDGLDGPTFLAFRPGDPSVTRRHGGLGMGLHTAQQLAHRLGGRITVRSVPGTGTTAVVELPRRCDHHATGTSGDGLVLAAG